MSTLFIDYQRLVLLAYEQKKENNTLPHGLKHLTPAKLKDECIMRCAGNLNKRDEKVIRDFCGDLNESKTCIAIIQKFDTDKFKPLVNFLKGKTDRTDAKNIELLAWLVDFPDRPWKMGKTYSSDVNESPASTDASAVESELATEADFPTNAPINEICKPAGNQKTPVISENSTDATNIGGSGKNVEGKTVKTDNQEKSKGNATTKRLSVTVLLSVVLGTGAIWWWKDKDQLSDFSGGCMYWNEDHYESIACDQKIPNAMIIALDTVRLKNFRKITMPDTITYLAKGKVWYSKIDGKIEFYTSGGDHPVVFGRRLKPITNYMIDKYIRSGIVTK